MSANRTKHLFIAFFCVCCLSLSIPCRALSKSDTPLQGRDFEAPDVSTRFQWGGHLKARGSVSWPDRDAIYHAIDAGPYYDGSFEGRLINTVFFSDHLSFETHYEAVCSVGDTQENVKNLKEAYQNILMEDFLPRTEPSDDRRLMDLTAIIDDGDRETIYHRLDRLSLALAFETGIFRIGRQALTWGNGFLFNPMDLFNPFSPTDFERDYKTGDDMLHLQLPSLTAGELQLLYVPRRDPDTADVGWDQSSLAGKYHISIGTSELDFMAAHHYEDGVVGLGGRGYLADAAWRIDTTWTFTQDRSEDFLSLTANLDYSWIWWQRNFYGFIEFYSNGLGHTRAAAALEDPWLIKRIQRGATFTLGKYYLDGEIQIELHPLFKILLTGIYNLEDHSGIWQPRASWDLSDSTQLILGAELFYGGTGTEYGGLKMPETDMTYATSDNVYVWITFFF
jgi:hypothetical protein